MTMKSEIFNHPSEQTYKAIAHCREPFAVTRGVTRSAIDHLLVGDIKDPYPAFRDFYKDVCATSGADPDAYLIDLQTIKQQFCPVSSKAVIEAYMSKLTSAHDLIETCAKALGDGGLDKIECRAILSKVGVLEDHLNELKKSVIDQQNILSGSVLPEEIKQKAKVRSINR